MEKLTKQDIKGPDAFQSGFEVVSHYFFHHRINIIAGVGVLLLIGIIWAGSGIYGSSVEEKAQESLFTAEKKLESTNIAFEKAKAPPAPPPKPGIRPQRQKPRRTKKRVQNFQNLQGI